MTISYFVSAKKSTVVSRTQVGNFTGPDDLNLIIDHGNRIDVQLVTPEGLKNVCEVPIYGRISEILLFKPKKENQDSLIVLTEKNHMAILAYRDEKIVTRVAGNIADRVGRLSDNGTVISVHPTGLIAVRIYDGTLKIIQWQYGTDLRHFNVRFECINVIDVKFMNTDLDIYRLAYISEDSRGRHLQIVDLSLYEKEFRPFARQENIANDSSFIIPVPQPAEGVIILGTETIIYKPNDASDAIVPVSSPLVNQTSFSAFAPIDKTGERFLLSDDEGRLLMLILNIEKRSLASSVVQEMKVEYLGEVSVADTISYLDNGVVYIGSRLGDSQLIRLTTTPNSDGSFIEVLETYTNIGPIRDMIHVDCDGQSQLITCSGAHKGGSLRIIRNGIGIEESASVDLPKVSNIFPIRYQSELDTHIVVSLPEETHVLKIDGEELEDVDFLDFDTTRSTGYAATLFDANTSGVVVQVTEKEVRLMAEGIETKVWKAPNNEDIAKISVNPLHGQIVIAARNHLYSLKCIFDEQNGLEIEQLAEKKLDNEIACIDLSNEGDDPNKPATFVALCLWTTISLEVFALDELKMVFSHALPTQIIPRSVIATTIDDIHYLLIAIGDGTLLYFNWNISKAELGEVKKSIVGTRPPKLHRIYSKKRQHLFVSSDRPAIIFSSNKKLLFSNVNVKMVETVCSLNSHAYRDCLVFSDNQQMVFGKVDDIQKIHVRTIPLGESARRIVHQKTTGTYGVLSLRQENSRRSDKYTSASRTALNITSSRSKTQRADMSESTSSSSASFESALLIFDHHTFQVLHAHEFGPYEIGISIVSAQLGDDVKHYFIVGAATVYHEDIESKSGRIIVFEVDVADKTKLRKVTELNVKGCPYSMSILNGKLLVSINSSVRLFEWTQDKELRLECSHFNNISAINIKTMGDQILVADLMRSVGLLTYRSMEGTFEEIATDWNCMWMSACDFITAERILGAEITKNLFTCEIDKSRGNTEDGRYVLEPNGFFYLGDMVNVMRKCTLVNPPTDSSIEYSHPITFGTIDGSIGFVVQIDDKWKKFLLAIEKAIGDELKNCMHIDHSTYRQFTQQKRYEPVTGFLDGDLIESILDVDRSTALKILSKVSSVGEAENLPSDPAEILKIIEDLARIH